MAGDPLGNISDVQKTVMTFEAGVRYDAAALYETVGVAAAVHRDAHRALLSRSLGRPFVW